MDLAFDKDKSCLTRCGSMLKNPALFSAGFHMSSFPLGNEILSAVRNRHWDQLDQQIRLLTDHGGGLFNHLRNYHDFSGIEFIISLRNAQNDWEEDGIWHDDGSRVFAFSLSLTENPESISGGHLGVRRKGQEAFLEIATPPFGDMILFLTGPYGFEHKIHQVTAGERIIIAGWCS